MPREILLLKDILKAVDMVIGFMNNVTESEFHENNLLRSGIVYQLIIIGEAVGGIPDDIKDMAPSVPWRQIRGFRNYAVHQYFSVDWNIVWETATSELLPLRVEVEGLLRSLESASEVD